eukprot:3284082-Amphidinium_carterae.1
MPVAPCWQFFYGSVPNGIADVLTRQSRTGREIVLQPIRTTWKKAFYRFCCFCCVSYELLLAWKSRYLYHSVFCTTLDVHGKLSSDFLYVGFHRCLSNVIARLLMISHFFFCYHPPWFVAHTSASKWRDVGNAGSYCLLHLLVSRELVNGWYGIVA